MSHKCVESTANRYPSTPAARIPGARAARPTLPTQDRFKPTRPRDASDRGHEGTAAAGEQRRDVMLATPRPNAAPALRFCRSGV